MIGKWSILYRLHSSTSAYLIRPSASSKRPDLQFNLLNRNPSGCPSPRSETCRAKGNTMQVPSILQGESLKRLLQGAAIGGSQQSLLAFTGVAGRSAAPLTRLQKSGQSWRS